MLHQPSSWPCPLTQSWINGSRLDWKSSSPAINSRQGGLREASVHPQTQAFANARVFQVPFLNSNSSQEEGEMAMISAKRIAQLAKKWRRMAALGRKRLTASSSSSSTATQEAHGCSTAAAAVAGKGHCAIYTADGARFEVPLAYLGTAVFGELLRVSQEEYGFSGDGRIMLPCDAMVMEYVMCLLGRNASVEVEKAFLSSMVMPCHNASCVASSSSSLGAYQQLAVCSN
ncbi:auxin-responsive protein SAUR36-like [Oryza brachyantha]|uniref:auxin-responsive protein SAUR36-like n=1 Tax=Oryza brachyantha TaxID=4533 RepID=UPI000776103D|nr:auxin-responsive protein SAUR36-like [Oryza brachyantha]